MTTTAAAAPDITVTTATRSEAELRETHAPEAAAAAAVPAAPAAPATPDPKDEEDARSAKTDAEVSEAARTLRRNRADSRKTKIQDEINTLVATREKTRAEVDQLKKLQAELAGRQAAPAAAVPPPPAATPSAAPAAAAAAPKFDFPSFDQYQEKHPDADYETYTDARSDARYAWNKQQETDAHARAEADKADVAKGQAFATSEQTFRDTHADYDAVLDQVQVPATPNTTPTTSGRPSPLHQLLHRDPTQTPALLYYLGQHPETVEQLAYAPTPAALLVTFGTFLAKALSAPSSPAAPAAAAATPPAARPPSQPVTSGAAPVSPVPGGATHSRSSAQLAEDSDDADAYIARRKQELNAAR